MYILSKDICNGNLIDGYFDMPTQQFNSEEVTGNFLIVTGNGSCK